MNTISAIKEYVHRHIHATEGCFATDLLRSHKTPYTQCVIVIEVTANTSLL